jgi:flagellar hook-associated protein 3 FlgL
MRITNSTLSNNFMRNLSRNLEQMQKYQNQLSAGKLVSKPSDDPMLISKIMDLRANIGGNEQYNSNISDSIGWVETQDGALNGATGILQRIRELVIYGANGSLSTSDRGAIKDEVMQNIEGLKDVLNTNFDGRYIFGGQATKTPPFSITNEGELLYKGDDINIKREIGKQVDVTLLTSGRGVVGESSSNPSDQTNELGKLLKNILTDLGEGGENDKLSGEHLENLDKQLESVLSLRSRIGAINNRLEAAKSRNEAENLNLNTLLSEREDIDIAEKFMEYSVMSTVYQASLAVGSKILQPGLLDYLR